MPITPSQLAAQLGIGSRATLTLVVPTMSARFSLRALFLNGCRAGLKGQERCAEPAPSAWAIRGRPQRFASAWAKALSTSLAVSAR
jgi:hypothetical protein